MAESSLGEGIGSVFKKNWCSLLESWSSRCPSRKYLSRDTFGPMEGLCVQFVNVHLASIGADFIDVRLIIKRFKGTSASRAPRASRSKRINLIIDYKNDGLINHVSLRRAAYIFEVVPRTIARRVQRFGEICAQNLESYRKCRPLVKEVQLDEMESFIHTKLKPVTIPIAVEKDTRKVLGVAIGNIGAKGHLKSISLKKYGRRQSERRSSLEQLATDLQTCVAPDACFRSDQSPFYPNLIRRHFPGASHSTCKGARGAVVGLGELKKVGLDGSVNNFV